MYKFNVIPGHSFINITPNGRPGRTIHTPVIFLSSLLGDEGGKTITHLRYYASRHLMLSTIQTYQKELTAPLGNIVFIEPLVY